VHAFEAAIGLSDAAGEVGRPGEGEAEGALAASPHDDTPVETRPSLIYMYIYVCVCVYICIYIYTYMYVHTHTHPHTHTPTHPHARTHTPPACQCLYFCTSKARKVRAMTDGSKAASLCGFNASSVCVCVQGG
jgi:hypothetical protein